MRRTPLVIATLGLAFVLAACDPNEVIPSPAPLDPAAGACLVGDPSCQDLGPTSEDQARALLGLTEDELTDDIRIARDGDEQYVLTEDYVIGRMTVELDPDAEGVSRVVLVTVELEEGPLTVTA